jgi:hypothetical protein
MALGREVLGRFVIGRPFNEQPGVFALAADVGAFALTGQETIGDQTAFVTDAEAGAYNLTGRDATLEKGSAGASDVGSYTLTGVDITDPPFGLTADVGAFTLSGQDAGVIAARFVSADRGTFTLTGVDTGTVGSLPCDVGAFVLTGQTAPRKTDGLIAELGTFTLTGQATDFSFGRVIDADAGEYVYTGEDLAFELLRAPIGIQANPRLSRPIVTASRAPQPVRIRSNYLRASSR